MGVVYDLAKTYVMKHPGGIAWRIKSHSKIVEKHLNDGEQVLYVFAGQKNDKIYDIFTSCVIAITNKRILIGQKRVVWGYFLKSISPDLYNDMKVYRGLLFGKVTIDTMKEKVVVSNLPKNALNEIETNVSELMMRTKHNLRNGKFNEKVKAPVVEENE